MKKLSAAVQKLADLVYDILLVYDRQRSYHTETELKLLRAIEESDESGLTEEEMTKTLNNVIWHAAQVYMNPPDRWLSEDEKTLMTKLQDGGYLTKDPGPELAPSFAP